MMGCWYDGGSPSARVLPFLGDNGLLAGQAGGAGPGRRRRPPSPSLPPREGKSEMAGVLRTDIFCPRCGTLLDAPNAEDMVACAVCDFSRDVAELENIEIVRRSGPEAFRRMGIESLPAPGAHDALEELAEKAQDALATVNEECPKCGHIGLKFYTMQLRSVDEGATVFYSCPECKHRFSTNN